MGFHGLPFIRPVYGSTELEETPPTPAESGAFQFERWEVAGRLAGRFYDQLVVHGIDAFDCFRECGGFVAGSLGGS